MECVEIIKSIIGSDDPFWITVISKVVDKIKQLPSNSETTIYELLGEDVNKFTSEQLFKIDEIVLKVCKKEKIELDFSKYAGQCVGVPYNIPFIKK